MDKEKRRKLLALIHTQKRDAALDDEIYVTILLNAAGVDSASRLENLNQFSAVIFALNKVLEGQGKDRMGGQINIVSPVIWSIQKRAKRLLGPNSEKRILGYIKAMGRSSLAECSDQELRRVQGFLSTLERRGSSSEAGNGTE